MSEITLKEKGLCLSFPDGESAYFNYFWLRDNCATAFDAETRERTFDLLSQPDDLHAEEARIEGEEMVVKWSGDGHESRYALGWLSDWSRGDGGLDSALVSRRLWYGDHYPQLCRLSYESIQASGQASVQASGQGSGVVEWAGALLRDGIALVEGMPDSDRGLELLGMRLGHINPSCFGYYFDVRQEPQPINLAYTSKALELHTDLPSEEYAPGVQLLHCRANAVVSGGESLFVDGAAVAEDFRELAPRDFALLNETLVPFRQEHEMYDTRARQRVIETDSDGSVSGITYSQHLADTFDLPQTLLDAYYPAFRRFGRLMQDSRYLMRFRLEAGQCVTFDNHRIAHGRTAFESGSGRRHLRGCYLGRGEVRSSYRIYARGGQISGAWENSSR
ncbi:MAG: TauD/TfdA family dioxygenase [Alphaproteobacteria bacterium]